MAELLIYVGVVLVGLGLACAVGDWFLARFASPDPWDDED